MTKFISPLATGFLKSLLFIIAILPLASCGNDDEPEPAPAPNPGGSEFIFSGTTTTYPVDAPESIYTSTKSTYTVAVAKDVESAVMCIQNADFLQGMPQLGEMLFQPITCSFDETANTLSLSSSAITPEIAGRPFPAFPITDYTATLIPGKSISLTFICTYRGTPYSVNFTGTRRNNPPPPPVSLPTRHSPPDTPPLQTPLIPPQTSMAVCQNSIF